MKEGWGNKEVWDEDIWKLKLKCGPPQEDKKFEPCGEAPQCVNVGNKKGLPNPKSFPSQNKSTEKWGLERREGRRVFENRGWDTYTYSVAETD
jgi:hypothetical protein